MTPKPDKPPRRLSVMFQMRVSEKFLEMVDDWRGKRKPIPSRAEAVRQLVEGGVKR